MKARLASILVFFLGLSLVNCVPFHRNQDDDKRGDKDIMDTIIKSNLRSNMTNVFEGDIEVSSDERILRNSDESHSKRNALRDRRWLWKSKVIPYEISIRDVGGGFTRAIRGAIAEFHKHTCLRFVPHTSKDQHWIRFVKRSWCSSMAGMRFFQEGGQNVNLGEDCGKTKGVVMHELLHALGFFHEQSRPDRDKYIEIMWENILAGKEGNFKKFDHSEINMLNKPYDYQSIMHYGSYSFSKNNKPTIRGYGPNKDATLGQREGFSKTDIFGVNALYDCSGPSHGWSSWSDFGPCDDSCGKKRDRFCASSDTTACPGANFFGVQEDRQKCPKAECNAPINGHWGKWSTWSKCSVTCGKGTRTRKRLCDDPSPKNKGKRCEGLGKEIGRCELKRCGLGADDCEFEFGMCSWSQANKYNTYGWHRHSGKTYTEMTGPDGDASVKKHGKGYYVYAEASQVNRSQVAKLQSNVFPAAPKGRCIEFAYSMYGSGIGALNVYVIDSKTGKKSKIFSKSGDQGPGWHRTNANFVSNNEYKISFESTRGRNFFSDIALDDILFQNGRCGKVSNPITPKPGRYRSVGCFKDDPYDSSLPFPKKS